MPKFFVSPDKVLENKIIIDTVDVSHITKVLRLKVDDVISVCDGAGFDYDAKISEMSGKKITCDILKKYESDTEPNIEVTLFQGIPKGSKMEYIIQKTTELGIRRIVPCVMQRCVAKLDDTSQKKIERWRKIAQEAAKQSGRGSVPEILEPVDFLEALVMLKRNDIFFVPYECEENTTLKPVLQSKCNLKTAAFMIGPEGGFDPVEIEKIKSENIATVTLGKRILRTETAGEAVLSMIMYEIGDINQITGGRK
ncbi:MAG: 16S rRNA (uracil(1498)-N(3))-methyltransferase [Clostridia bacterium]|nr:16S rRNA (uracil(1498)-N(3))-methyltransferase [Clostridia bacterium]